MTTATKTKPVYVGATSLSLKELGVDDSIDSHSWINMSLRPSVLEWRASQPTEPSGEVLELGPLHTIVLEQTLEEPETVIGALILALVREGVPLCQMSLREDSTDD